MSVEDLIDAYNRKIEMLNELIIQEKGKMSESRLIAKRFCYRAFVKELKEIKKTNENTGRLR